MPFKVEDEPKHKKIKDEPMSPEVVAGCSKFESVNLNLLFDLQ